MKQLLKRTMIAALFATCAFTTYSQSFAIANPLGSTFYIGFEYPISGFVEGYKSKDIFLVADKGKLNKQEGKYFFHADSLGIVNISIYVKKGSISKKIGSSKFGVIEWPYIGFANIGGKKDNDTISKKSLIIQGGVRALYKDICSEMGVPRITSFHALIIKKDSSVSKRCFNDGNGFNEGTRKLLSTIEAGDQLLIYSILARTPYGNKISIEPLLLSIAE